MKFPTIILLLINLFLPVFSEIPSVTLEYDVLDVRVPYSDGFFSGKKFRSLRVTLDVSNETLIKQVLPLNFSISQSAPKHDLLLSFPVLQLPKFGELCSDMLLNFTNTNGKETTHSRATCLDNDPGYTNYTYLLKNAAHASLTVKDFYSDRSLNNSLVFTLTPAWSKNCPSPSYLCPLYALMDGQTFDYISNPGYCILAKHLLDNCNVSEVLMMSSSSVLPSAPHWVVIISVIGVIVFFCFIVIIIKLTTKKKDNKISNAKNDATPNDLDNSTPPMKVHLLS